MRVYAIFFGAALAHYTGIQVMSILSQRFHLLDVVLPTVGIRIGICSPGRKLYVEPVSQNLEEADARVPAKVEVRLHLNVLVG